MGMPSVNKEEAKNFAKVWNLNGIAIIVDDTAVQFATDFANVVLRSFVQQAAQAQGKQTAPQPPAKPKSSIILTDGD